MLKRQSFYIVALFSVAMFMTAGCATQGVVKKDEGIVSASGTKQSDQPKPNVTSPNQTTPTPVSPGTLAQTPTVDHKTQDALSSLQSALERIYFDFDSANLSETARTALNKNAAILLKDSSAKIRIEGNCDERGSAEYNLALGERRAESAQQYLRTLGVKADRLSTISYGKEKPAVQGNDETAMAKNRRDEFVVITK